MISRKQEKEMLIALAIILFCMFLFSIVTGDFNISRIFVSSQEETIDKDPTDTKKPEIDDKEEEPEKVKPEESEEEIIIEKEENNTQNKQESVRDDYAVEIKSVRLKTEKSYFKSEKIDIVLSATIKSSDAWIEKVEVNGKWYSVTKTNSGLLIQVDGFSNAGNQVIHITKLKLNNSQEIEILKELKVEINKDFPSVNYEYDFIEASHKLNVKIQLEDKEQALDGKIHVLLKNQKNELIEEKVLESNSFDTYFENVSFDSYLIEIKADVSLSSQKKITSYLLGSGMIKLENRAYELKNIEDIQLYKKDGEKVVKVSEDEDITEINKDKYLVEVVLSNAPSRYTMIKKVQKENDKIYLNLDLENYIQYEGDKKKNTVVLPYPYHAEDVLGFEFENQSNYDQERSLLYQNLLKLMPYYDSKYIIEDGNQLPTNHLLKVKKVKAVLPFSKGKMITFLSDQNYNQLDTIKLVFEDGTIKDYQINFKSYIENIANYNIPELKTNYNYENYVMDTTANGYQELLSTIKNYNFETDIYPLGKNGYIARDKRMYFDHFKEFQANSESFIASLASNNNVSLYLNQNLAQDYAVQFLKENNTLEKVLFAYNYIHKWYDFEVGGINLSDVLFFNDSMLQNKLDAISFGKYIVTNVGANMQNGDNTANFYNTYLKKYTGLNSVSSFIEYFISNYAGYEDVNDWIVENFKGVAVEIPSTYLPQKIRYRIWDYMKNSEVRGEVMILPILSVKSNDMYLLSLPTQLCIGSMKVYGEYNPNNPATREKMRKKIENFGKQVALFYDTTSRIINNSVEILNSVRNLQVDRRIIDGILQEAGTTEDPIIKNVYVPLNIMPAANGSAAYATGSATFWNYQLLNCFSIFTHETAHNQDGRIFLERYGRRWQGWAEDYADGNITQGSNDGSLNFNLSIVYNKNSDVTSNLTPERINSREKIGDFYKKMFETINTLDYLEAQAFLKLSAKDQSKVADQHYYPNLKEENQTDYNARVTSKWRTLSESDFALLQLKTVEDLWDHQIMIRPGKANGSSLGANLYGGESIYNVNWYQPHNDYGRPNSYAMKRLAFEMLGEAGYDGYIAYYSGQNKTDLAALQKIMKSDTITWKEYKMQKYEQIEESLEKGSPYFNSEELIALFVKAMQLDAADSNSYNNTYSNNLRNALYHYLQRATDDFRTGIYESEQTVSIYTAKQFVEEMKKNPIRNFVLKNDIDLTGYTGNNSITDVAFLGHLNGNGHKIIGASQPIFTSIKYSYIENLILEQANISLNVDNVGILSKTATRSIFINIYMKNSKVESKSRVGVLVGTASNSILYKISSKIGVTIKEDRGGSIVAEAEGTALIDSYSLGTVTQISNTSSGAWHIGGLVGRISAGGGIHSCYSATYVEQKNTRVERAAGGLIGKSEGNHAVINSFSVSNGVNIYRFDGYSIRNDYKSGFYNNFEYENSNGRTNQGLIDYDMNGIINVATKENFTSIAFYQNQLKWDSPIWNLSQVENGYLPTLKSNLDQNDKEPIPELPKNESEVSIPEVPVGKIEELPLEEEEATEDEIYNQDVILPNDEIEEIPLEEEIQNENVPNESL